MCGLVNIFVKKKNMCVYLFLRNCKRCSINRRDNYIKKMVMRVDRWSSFKIRENPLCAREEAEVESV